jgi:hypothetical protein
VRDDSADDGGADDERARSYDERWSNVEDVSVDGAEVSRLRGKNMMSSVQGER